MKIIITDNTGNPFVGIKDILELQKGMNEDIKGLPGWIENKLETTAIINVDLATPKEVMQRNKELLTNEPE